MNLCCKRFLCCLPLRCGAMGFCGFDALLSIAFLFVYIVPILVHHFIINEKPISNRIRHTLVLLVVIIAVLVLDVLHFVGLWRKRHLLVVSAFISTTVRIIIIIYFIVVAMIVLWRVEITGVEDFLTLIALLIYFCLEVYGFSINAYLYYKFSENYHSSIVANNF